MRTLLVPFALCLAAAPAFAQIPCYTANLGTNLGLSDESMSAAQNLGFTFTYNGVGYSQIRVCSNGYITLGGTGGVSDYDPQAATLVNDPFARICPLWSDLEPGVPGGGDVFFRAVPASGSAAAHAVITWDGVWDYGGTTPHTFQLCLIDGGQVRIHYGNDLALIGDAWLVGASPGNGATQNPVDFGTLPILTAGNATLHQVGNGPLGRAGATLDWLPDGTGGYVVVENTQCATVTNYGRGCIAQFGSFYEHFVASPSIDLSNTGFSMLLTGSSYVVIPGAPAFVQPSAAATNLGLDDDNETTVTLSAALPVPGGSTTSLNVCSNGHISTASNGAAGSFAPNRAEFVAWANTTWACWHDFVPSINGPDNIWFEEANGIAYITWLNVVSYDGLATGVTPSTLQFQFDLASGNVSLVFQTLDTLSIGFPGAAGWIVGLHAAGSTLDPGSVDLSTDLPLSTYAIEVAPLQVDASALPLVGTLIHLDTTNIPVSAPFGAIVLGLTTVNPGFDLTGIGMARCFRYTDNLATLLFFPLGSSTVSTPFQVPNMPGVTVSVQALAYAPSAPFTTPLGALASNGMALQLGF